MSGLRLKRVAQIVVLAGVATFAQLSLSAAPPMTCEEFYDAADSIAEDICGAPPSSSDCSCTETEYGIVEAECLYEC